MPITDDEEDEHKSEDFCGSDLEISKFFIQWKTCYSLWPTSGVWDKLHVMGPTKYILTW